MRLADDLVGDVAMHIGQAEFPARVFEREFFMIQP